MALYILKIFFRMFKHLFRRGRGIFKFLFAIDDFFRIFTMTIIIPIFFNWLNFSVMFIVLGAVLGLIIDVHDFISQMGVAKIET